VYRLQIAFYAHLIADTIGTWPELAHVILVDGRRDTFPLAGVREHYESVLGGVVRVKEGEEPPVHISSTCGECPWEPACLTHAEETRDVSLTYGLQRRIATLLREEGIATLAGLAAQDPAALAARAGIAPGHAATLVIRRRCWRTGSRASGRR
jgi:predicted RecB family nuclease